MRQDHLLLRVQQSMRAEADVKAMLAAVTGGVSEVGPVSQYAQYAQYSHTLIQAGHSLCDRQEGRRRGEQLLQALEEDAANISQDDLEAYRQSHPVDKRQRTCQSGQM